MAIRGFSLEGSASGAKSQKTEAGSRSKRAIPTTAGLVNCKFGKITCFCEGSHTSESCPKAQSLSFAEKRNLAVKKGCCFACLKPGHRERRCRAVLRCVLGKGRHVSVMSTPTDKVLEAKEAPVVESSLSNIYCSNQVFLQTIMVTLRGERDRQVRVLMDPGSQRSYVRKDTARSMKYAPIGEELIHGLFGGETTKPRHHFYYNIRLRSLDNKYACNFEALDEEDICSRVPALPVGPWLSELRNKGIGVFVQEEKPIEVLIGADVYGKLLNGRREILVWVSGHRNPRWLGRDWEDAESPESQFHDGSHYVCSE